MVKFRSIHDFIPSKRIIAYAENSFKKSREILKMQSKEKFDKTAESRYSQKNYKREMKNYIEARNQRKILNSNLGKELKDQEMQKRKKFQKMIHKFKLKKSRQISHFRFG
jgi:hypothetical protein